MAINPLAYMERVVRSFLRYQLTAYPFADDRLNEQMRRLLSLEETRDTPLLRGPYVSLSRAFRSGASVSDLISQGVFHEHMKQLVPYDSVYGHQEEAIRAIYDGRPTLVSTGTGSGKSECFLYPVISRCLQLRDEGAEPGICAVIVYPMNALAEDQLGRLRELLAGSGITFGMYVGKTPEREADVTGFRLGEHASRADYRHQLDEMRSSGSGAAVHPAEEVCSRQVMRTPGRQPRILLTNVKQLELLLTRQSDIELFEGARLDYLVFDEAHTFTGAQGAEAACLVRRLRSFCGRTQDETVCVATSATIVDEANPDAARDFASRFFGVAQDTVTTVNEAYEPEVWAEERVVPDSPADPLAALDAARQAVDAEDPEADIRSAWRGITGKDLPAGPWQRVLHEQLSTNELLFRASERLSRPGLLSELVAELSTDVGRQVSEEELIAWLTLGAAAEIDGRPLLRPVVHAFIRGVPGAVVVFEDESSEPNLLLSAEDDEDGEETRLRLKVSTCTTCGQHYFEHHLSDFSFTGASPGGGLMDGQARYWEPMESAHGGIRVILTDRLISSDSEDDEDEHNSLHPIFLCRSCGGAHSEEGSRCLACGMDGGMLRLHVVKQKQSAEGNLPKCVCCGAAGRSYAGRFREPAKAVRAVNVSDVHVLTQDMIHHAERRRLLVFADNRQDAAFQAGWMRDHARRFRLRALMSQLTHEGPLSIGDLVHRLDALMDEDENLSRSLLPELWMTYPASDSGTEHGNQRRYLLRIHVLLELTVPAKQQLGLEPWGRWRASYAGLDETAPFIQKWARELRIPADELQGGVAAMLDMWRREKILRDSVGGIFSRIWAPGDRDLENGFLPPLPGVPKGLKLTRAAGDRAGWVKQLLSPGHQTTASQIAGKWGVASDDLESFLGDLWQFLVSPETALLVPVTLKGNRGGALPNCHGTHQVDGNKILITPNASGCYRCRTCRRRTARRTPHMRCLAWHCDGELEHMPENPDSYDLQLIDDDYTMLRPREHTAMVPNSERELLENMFKGDSEAVNALVCTQTLELGVDIGALDAVLLRNVPPLPANYWQRVGRAGRRHRMAVDLTYCRQVSHDRAYFSEPLRMLEGRIDPPSFNLSNALMVAKHVHATIITTLYKLSRDESGVNEGDRAEVSDALTQAFPRRISKYLFDDAGNVLSAPLDVSVLHTVITKHQAAVEGAVVAAFRQGWPDVDAEVVTDAALSGYVLTMTRRLEEVITRLFRRLRWAQSQMRQLERIRERAGAFDEEQSSFYNRCQKFVRKLKGTSRRHRREAEGVDSISTYGVLAAEGFLPGYGLDTGSVVGMAEVPRWVRGLTDFDLPRPPSVALREYVPGNLIYANGQKFIPRRFAREVGEDMSELIVFEVNPDRQAVQELDAAVTGSATTGILQSIPICDVTLVHASRISDEEENRFQMSVAVYGRELGRHSGGSGYRWGPRNVQLLRGAHLQLVNVGVPSVIRTRGEYGYPICKVCGQSVSPFSSDLQRDTFKENHREWCGQDPQGVGFHADLVVDALVIRECENRREAYSIMEALRFAAVNLLDMDMRDLQVLVLGRADRDEPDAWLYDPMPGGSGLLQKICERFEEITAEALRLAAECPALCSASCIDCFQTYRNAFYHEHLDRNLIVERIDDWGNAMQVVGDIPARQPSPQPSDDNQPDNMKEDRLRSMVEMSGLPEGLWQETYPLPRPLNSTRPDITFTNPDDETKKIFVYLDGLSAGIHGNPQTQARDRQIRAELRAEGHDVIEIAVSHLDDQGAMTRHLQRLARLLIGREAVNRVSNESAQWFTSAPPAASSRDAATSTPFVLLADPPDEERYASCVPVYDLAVAAGSFSEGQVPEPQGWAQFESNRPFTREMFVAQVVGRSMEPLVPDESWCLFAGGLVGGSRDGRDLLVQHHEISDPDHGGRYTLKRYRRPPRQVADGEDRGGTVTLEPLNPDYEPIKIENDLDEFKILAELLEVLG